MKFLSWNINGFRAITKKNFWPWFQSQNADFVCLQETKILSPDFQNELGLFYQDHWFLNSAQKPGYSGVAVLTKHKPESVEYGLGEARFDTEGRSLFLHYKNFTLINLYIPNGQRDLNRVPYKLEYSDCLMRKVQTLRKTQPNIILCGDFNVAHHEVDIKNPVSNRNNSGFTQPERDWMTKFLAAGFYDTFRHFHPEAKDHYTWWSYRPGVRQRNIGWRIDYFIVTQEFLPQIKDATIQMQTLGSDHCPVELVTK